MDKVIVTMDGPMIPYTENVSGNSNPFTAITSIEITEMNKQNTTIFFDLDTFHTSFNK